MSIYLLLPLPALIAALWSTRLSATRLFFVWITMSVLTAWLMPIGSRDYPIYLRDFADFNANSFFHAASQDPLYGGVVWLFGHLGGDAEVFYVLLACFGLWVKLTAIGRLSRQSSLVVLIYACSYFFLHDFTQIRAGLAIGIWMHALANLPNRPGRYLLLTALASLIHLQAAVGVLAYAVMLLTRWRMGVWVLIAISIATLGLAATPAFDLLGISVLSAIPDARTAIYLDLASNDLWVRPNPYSAISLLAMFAAIVGLFGLPAAAMTKMSNVNRVDAPRAIFVALMLGSGALVVLSSVSVAAFRVSEHFFSLLPVGLWLAACRGRAKPRYLALLWMFAGLMAYLFLFYSPYLLDPVSGEPNE